MGKGQLIRVGRGRYMLPEAEHSENLGLALVAAAVPQSVICLLSALRFHGIGTQAPHEVWIAVAQGAARPRLDYPPVRVTLVSGSAFTFGVERHQVDGVPVCIYSPAKTVADCFKFRNKIGLDVAIEALREALRDLPHGTMTRLTPGPNARDQDVDQTFGGPLTIGSRP